MSPAYTDWLYILPTPEPPNPTPPVPAHSELIAPLGGQSEELCRAPTFLPLQQACFLPLDRPGHSCICCAFK